MPYGDINEKVKSVTVGIRTWFQHRVGESKGSMLSSMEEVCEQVRGRDLNTLIKEGEKRTSLVMPSRAWIVGWPGWRSLWWTPKRGWT